MLIIGLTVVLVGSLILCILKVLSDDYHTEGYWFGLVLSAGFLFLMGIFVLSYYIDHSVEIRELQAFKEVNVENYATTVTETEALLSQEKFVGFLVKGSLEKTQLGSALSERLKEWRDAVNDYNLKIARMRAIREMWLIPGFLVMPPLPEDLIPLKIRE